MKMKRLVSFLLVLCMLLPTFAFGEEFFGSAPVDEAVQTPVEEELPEIELPEIDLPVIEQEVVEGPAIYNRDLVLLQPTDLVGKANSVTEIELSWSPVAHAVQYNILRKLAGETDYTEIDNVPSSQLYYVDSAVTPGVVVYYRIQAVGIPYDEETGLPMEPIKSLQSNTLPFITMKKPVMSTPYGMDADSVRLTWNHIVGASAYEVEMATSPEGPFTLARKDLTGNLCNVDGLKNKTGYYFRVRAVRVFSSGEKFYSEYSDVKLGTPMERPVLSITADGNDAILSWTKCQGATSYSIWRKIDGGNYENLAITGDVTTYIDADREVGKVCYYFVYARYSHNGNDLFSLASETRWFTVVDGVELCAVQNTGTQQQTINWVKHATGANKYHVYAATELNGIYEKIGECYSTKFVANNLTPGLTYFYKVRPVREFSNGDVAYGPWSNIMSMPESGTLSVSGLRGRNMTVNADIAGGYVGDVFSWAVDVEGGSGAYDFKWSLVSIDGAGSILLSDFTGSYTPLEEGKTVLTKNYGMVLTEQMVDAVTNQKYAMQVEVRDSLGAVGGIYACGDTWYELNFVAPAPVSMFKEITMRAGDTADLVHGIFAQAGDAVIMDISNPTGAITVTGNTITANANGYATILITPARFKNDVLIAYHITIGYATLAVNRISPSTMNTHTQAPINWDIQFTGGRPNYTVEMKVYQGNTIVAERISSQTTTGLVSTNYTPTTPGQYTLEVVITSADGQKATMRSAVTTVTAYNPVTIMPSTTSTTVGSSITWVTSYKGDDTVYRRDYTLFRDGVVVSSTAGRNDFAFTHTPTVAGAYVLQVKVYESNGNVFTTTSATVTVTNEGSPVSGTQGRVTGDKVALRKGPGTQYDVITRLNKGKIVTIVKLVGNWYYVSYNGTYGYISADYVVPVT